MKPEFKVMYKDILIQRNESKKMINQSFNSKQFLIQIHFNSNFNSKQFLIPILIQSNLQHK